MMTPYVQNVTKWISHYEPKNNTDVNVTPPNDSQFTNNNGSLAQEGHMNVAQVETKGPPPTVPSTGQPTALKTVSTSQAAVQQAVFDAKRDEIEKSESQSSVSYDANTKKKKRKPHKKASTQHMKKKASSSYNKVKSKNNLGTVSKTIKKSKKKDTFFDKSALLGTPGDIFKSKISKKKKK